MMTLRGLLPLFMTVVVGTSSLADIAVTNSIDQYKSIAERNPFRNLTGPGTGPASSMIEGMVLTGIYYEQTTKKVWIRDTRSNRTFYVGEGEPVADYRVEKIDVENQSVLLSHGVETKSLAFVPAKNALPQPASVITPPRPGYRGPAGIRPIVPVTAPAPNPAPATPTPVPAAVAAANPPSPARANQSPTSLRRRIMRQQNPPAAAAPAAQPEAKEGEAEQPAEEAPAQQ
jgi:hypothetical protein